MPYEALIERLRPWHGGNSDGPNDWTWPVMIEGGDLWYNGSLHWDCAIPRIIAYTPSIKDEGGNDVR